MKKEKVSALVPEKKDASGKVLQKQLGPVEVEVQYAETLAEAEKLFGAEAVLSNAFANWRVTLQANIRGALKRGEDPSVIKSRLSAAKMGVAQAGVKVDPEAAFRAKFVSATPEEQKRMIEQLKKMAAGA
jgi:hypothetical protein